MASITRAPASTRTAPVRESTAAPWSAELVPASLPQRILGGAIDAILIAVVVGLSGAWIAARTQTTVQVRIDAATGERIVVDPAAGPLHLLTALPVLLTALYVIVGIALAGRTLGGWAVGIRCIRARTGGRPGWGVAVRRWAILFGVAAVLGLVPVIGPWAWLATVAVALSPVLDRTGWMRGWQDRIAGDLVVRTRDSGPDRAPDSQR